MDDDQSMEESRCDLDKPYKNTWRPHQNTVKWYNLKLAQKKGLQFRQTRSHAIVLYNTLPAICIDKAVCMKTKEELYHKGYQSPWLPRVKLKPNSNLIKKQENPQTTKAYREVTAKPAAATSTMEYPAYSILQSNNRTRIAEKQSKSSFSSFREYRTRSFFLQDLNKTEEINTFSERSKKLITDMGNTEIFELCETSSKKQCPDCV